MVTHSQLVRYYLRALRHWEANPAVRALCASVDLGRRGYAELFAARHLDATAWTTGTGVSGNAAYADAVALLAAAPARVATQGVTGPASRPMPPSRGRGAVLSSEL